MFNLSREFLLIISLCVYYDIYVLIHKTAILANDQNLTWRWQGNVIRGRRCPEEDVVAKNVDERVALRRPGGVKEWKRWGWSTWATVKELWGWARWAAISKIRWCQFFQKTWWGLKLGSGSGSDIVHLVKSDEAVAEKLLGSACQHHKVLWKDLKTELLCFSTACGSVNDHLASVIRDSAMQIVQEIQNIKNYRYLYFQVWEYSKSSSKVEWMGAPNFWLHTQCGCVRAARWRRWMNHTSKNKVHPFVLPYFGEYWIKTILNKCKI